MLSALGSRRPAVTCHWPQVAQIWRVNIERHVGVAVTYNVVTLLSSKGELWTTAFVHTRDRVLGFYFVRCKWYHNLKVHTLTWGVVLRNLLYGAEDLSPRSILIRFYELLASDLPVDDELTTHKCSYLAMCFICYFRRPFAMVFANTVVHPWNIYKHLDFHQSY